MALPAAEITLQVPFHDVDTMEIAWHGHYVKYFEIARTALLEQVGYNYPEMRDSGFAWPIIELKIRYAHPARFGQLLTVRAQFIGCEMRLKIGYISTDAKTGARLTHGHTVQVAVDMASEEMLLSSPKVLTDKIKKS